MKVELVSDPAFEQAISAVRLSRESPLTVHLVANKVRGDSRVLKSAQASHQSGHAALIIGITPGEAAEHFTLDGVGVLLVPMSISTENRQVLLSNWRRWDRHLSLSRALHRSTRPTRLSERVRALLRASFRRDGETSWSATQPNLLDINLQFATTLASFTPDLVHVHDAHGLPAALAYRARFNRSGMTLPRVAYDSHECIPLAAKNFPRSSMHQALLLIEREFIPHVDTVLTVSLPLAQYLSDKYSLPHLPTVVLNCPAVSLEPRGQDVRQAIGLESAQPLAVYSGWLERQRGVETVVRALAHLPELHLVLVINRKGGELKRLLRVANSLGVSNRVHTAPYVDPSHVPEYLSTATFGVLPFKPAEHLALSLPTKYYEYSVARLPSLASNFGELAREINTTGFGRVFEPADSDDLAKQASALLSGIQQHRARLQHADLQGYMWGSQAPVLTNLYGRLITNAGEPERDS